MASPTGFPFKVVELEGTASDEDVYLDRERVCNLGQLRTAYKRDELGKVLARMQRNREAIAALREAIRLEPDDWRTHHALGLLLAGILVKLFPTSTMLVWAGIMMIAGILLFSGSLYILSITGIRWLGAITPFGGTAFILAWIFVVVGLTKHA